MLVKTSELTGAALDWAVAKCEGTDVEYINDGITQCLLRVSPFTGVYSPSVDWAQGGPVIAQEKIDVYFQHDLQWCAANQNGFDCIGKTPLIAAMRCYVASKLGDEVEIPEELL